MAEEPLSLNKYLRRPNPCINNQHALKGPTTSCNEKFDEPLRAKDVKEWTDFQEDALETIYGTILERNIHQHNPDIFAGALSDANLREIHDEDSLEALLIRWNYGVVSTALSIAQRQLTSPKLGEVGHCADEISMVRGGQAPVPSLPNQHKKACRPDWAAKISHLASATKRTQKCQESTWNILPGDTKLSTKWKSSMDKESNPEYLKPLNQIFRYCKHARVRYGYLLTQEELAVIRISWIGHTPDNVQTRITDPERRHSQRRFDARLSYPKPKQETKCLELKSISWANNANTEPGTMTVNLALWCLHMMAARERSLGWGYPTLLEEYHTPDARPRLRQAGSSLRSVKRRRSNNAEGNDSLS